MSKTFETAVAPAELDCAPTGKCICSRPECRKCFPPRPDEFGPPIVNSEAWIVDKQVSEKVVSSVRWPALRVSSA